MASSLTEQQIKEMLDHMKGSDSVELKLTVPDTNIGSTAVLLGMDPLEAEIRQIVFFDTPDLSLNQVGLVVRARRIQGGAGDTVVKLRPIHPDDLPPEMSASQNVKVEVDAMPRGFVCSASMKGLATAAAVRSVTIGESAIKRLFSKEQRVLFRSRAPEGLKLNDLAILGPINILKLVFEPTGLKRKFVAELWLYPDGSRLLELSTKCPPSKAFQVAAECREYIAQKGIDLTAEQQPKTNRALKYFSAQYKKAEEARQAASAADQTLSGQDQA